MKKILKKSFCFIDFKISNDKNYNILFICDHASFKIPKEYNNLGLSKKEISSHIGGDIGAKELTIELTKKLNSSCFLSNFSRLLIDPNRSLNDEDLIINNSFGTHVPGNNTVSKEEVNYRITMYYRKYHEALKKVIREKVKKKKLFLIAIHSFTKETPSSNRANEIGILWNKDNSLLVPLMRELNKKKISVGNNFPYPGFFFNHTLDYHSKKKNLINLSIEIRNDLICNKKGIKKWSKILKTSFETILEGI